MFNTVGFPLSLGLAHDNLSIGSESDLICPPADMFLE